MFDDNMAPRGLVLHAHAFAEEMNKMRRMAAIAARRLAATGHAVLRIDLFGCGDSSGDFGDATWQDWHDDLAAALAWLRARHGAVPLWLWGERAGALLAAELAARLDCQTNLLLWQPVQQGAQTLQQFLRLEAAGSMIDSGGQAGKGVVSELRRRLRDGEPVDVGGYRLAPTLATGLESAALQAPRAGGRVVWLEMAREGGVPLSQVAAGTVARWRQDGVDVQARTCAGPAFWQTTEIEDAPALIETTVAMLAEVSVHA